MAAGDTTAEGGEQRDGEPETVGGPEDLSADQRDAVEALLRSMADDEFVLAERYTEWQVRSPTLESDLSLSNIAQDELGHARIWYDALQDLGYTEQALLWERDPGEFRHCVFVERPWQAGDWADTVLRNYFFDQAERLRLDAVAESAYVPIAGPVEKIRSEEQYHREHAANWVERLAADDEGLARLQDALDRRFADALTLFEPTSHERAIVRFGFRARSLADMREEWLEQVVPFLESLGLSVPIDEGEHPEELLPEVRGRDGEHTDAWRDLYDEFTHTYRELDRGDVRRLRGDDDA